MWPFKRKPSPTPELPTLIFKSGEAFFEIQCKYGHTDIEDQQGIVAIVLDAKADYGTDVAVKLMPNGCQLATIKVASPDGGFWTLAKTASSNGDQLKPGDLVVWVPMVHMKKFAESGGDQRQGWIGLIIAKIAPESNPNTNELRVICHY